MSVIAVVNDDSAFIDLMSELLSDEGYTTIPHKVGNTAYDMIRAKQPDLVILDIRLEKPDSGWVVLDLMRLDPATTKIPVIICSGDVVFLRAKQEQLRAKDCFILEKPFDLDQLLAMTRAALNHSL